MMSNNLISKFILFIILWLWMSVIAMAQSPHFKNYLLAKGKKGIAVNTIFQDSFGYIWFGSTQGLFRFDGINYLSYTAEKDLSDDNITAIGQDSAGTLWIGRKNGKISRLKGNVTSGFALLDSLITEPITSFLFSENDTWIGTSGNGLFRVKGNTFQRYDSEFQPGDDYIYDIEKDGKGNLWIGSDIGLLFYDSGSDKWQVISMKDGLPDNIIRDVEIDQDGMIWIGTDESGVAMYDPAKSEVTSIPMWKFGQINRLLIRNKGEIWISTREEGLIKLEFSGMHSFQYKKYSTQNGLISNETNAIYLDNEKNVWLAAKQGVSLFTGNLFEFLTTGEGLPSNEIFSFLIDSKSRYWICSKNGLFIMEKSVTGEFSSKRLLHGPAFANHSFTSVYEDAKGFVWVGTYGYGVYRFAPDASKYECFNQNSGLSNNNIISISGSGNKIWLSTFGGGVAYCDISTPVPDFKNISTKDGLGSNYIYSSFTDSEGRTWFAKDGGGLAYLEKEHIRSFGQSDSVSNVIYGIVQDKDGNLWFTTPNQGIMKYNGKNFSYYRKEDNLLANSYQSIIADDFGNLIFAGNEGITVYNRNHGNFQNYTEEDGVSYLEPNLNAVFKDKDGSVWICTNQGLVKYNPKVQADRIVHPKLVFTACKADDIDLLADNITLSYKQNNLEFRYLAFWYKAPEKLVYRYMLKGHDSDWGYETRNQAAIYSSLPPGKFTFLVQVSSEPGNWTDASTAEFSFHINPPLWQRLWFIVLMVIFVGSGVYLTFRLRLAGLQKAKARLEQEVLKRTAEIERQRDEIEIKNRNITDSILYASRIQNALLPPDEDIAEIFPEHFILFRPRDIVSGDYYWLTRKNDDLVVVAADCTGHGVPGAFMSMLGVAFLNEIVNRAGNLVAAHILNELRAEVKKSLRQTGKKDEAKDGMDIALCIINKKEMKLQFAGAYNPLYLVRNKELIQLKADRMPIGIYYKEKDSFTNHTIEILRDDCIYLFSDGYIDQFGGKDGKKFLTRQFQELILSIHAKPMHEQKQVMSETLEKWKGRHDQLDDILVIGFKIT